MVTTAVRKPVSLRSTITGAVAIDGHVLAEGVLFGKYRR